jgi:hypothetical protein
MGIPAPELVVETLRRHVVRTVERGTDLIADLRSLALEFEVLMPELADATEAERWAAFARIAAVDPAVREHLTALVETLADVLAGLSATDGGAAWLQLQRTRLEAGEDTAAA